MRKIKMAKMKTLFLISWATFVLTGGYPHEAVFLFAQSGTGTVQSGSAKLREQETRGAGVYLQHCTLCHLPMKEKGRSTPSYGPPLAGVFKGATPTKEKVLREFILKGTDKMPGWQYGLEPKEIDDLIAYLKTL
jgi:mono/diheme cytochrome c family protein